MAKKSRAKVTYTTLFADKTLDPKFDSALKRFTPNLGQRHPMFIGGQEVWSDAGEFQHMSPIDTSIVVGRFQIGTRDHARAAIEAAKAGFGDYVVPRAGTCRLHNRETYIEKVFSIPNLLQRHGDFKILRSF